MDSRPAFHYEADGELTLRATQEAVQSLPHVRSSAPSKAQNPTTVLTQARRRVVAGGGNPRDSKLVASQSSLQFGQYQGRTFKWLLENDLGYTVMVLSVHQKEREAGNTSDTPLMSNKDALLKYASSFPEVAQVIQQRRARDTQADGSLVGFGVHKKSTYKELYESGDREKRSYVQWLRVQASRPGTKMEGVQKYIQKRDAELAHSSPSSQSSTATSGPSPRPPTPLRKPPKASEPTDDELLTCAAALETSDFQ